MIIAVDGPTASGKGTIARALAEHFGLPVLDTGLLYRAVGYQTQLNHGDPDDAVSALAACDFPDTLLDDPALRYESTGSLATRQSIPKCAGRCSGARSISQTSLAARYSTAAISAPSSPPRRCQAVRNCERGRARAPPSCRNAVARGACDL